MSQTKWSYTKVNTSRQCKRKFFFRYVLGSRGRTNQLRRKTYELGKMQTFDMWQGSVVDTVMTKVVLPAMIAKQSLDFERIAEEAVTLAKKQFSYSEQKLYRQTPPKKKDRNKEDEEQQPCILEVHELNKPVEEKDIHEALGKIKSAILNLPNIKMPGKEGLLVDYLRNSHPLIPNVQSWSFEIEGIRINPQMDLVGYQDFKPFVIDWKVSESMSSDYSRQLAICGMTVYYTRLRTAEAEGKKPYTYEDIRLFKVNLLEGEVEEYHFSEDDINDIIDTINLTGGDIETMECETWEEVDMASLSCTENEANCQFCGFKLLCTYLYLNNHEYDEEHYLQSIQAAEFAGA